jgi:hypothetical protein
MALASWLMLALVSLPGCKLYRGELIEPDSSAGMSGSGVSGSGGSGGTGPCVQAPEVCNAIDDDCDGEIDDGAEASCDVVLNGASTCIVFDGGPTCVFTGECLPGFANCDGEPSNGCEDAFCECNPCDDAGDDASADDAGSDAGL